MNEEDVKRLVREITESVKGQRQEYILAYEKRLLKTIENQAKYVIDKNKVGLGIQEYCGPQNSNDLRQEIRELQDAEASSLSTLINAIGKELDQDGKIPLVLSEQQRVDLRHQVLTDILDTAKQEVAKKISIVKKQVIDAVSKVQVEAPTTLLDGSLGNIEIVNSKGVENGGR